MEWIGIGLLAATLVLGVAVFVIFLQFLNVSRQNKERYEALAARMDRLVEKLDKHGARSADARGPEKPE